MNVLGFDDGPFDRDHRGDVLLVGVFCSGTRMDGLVRGSVRRDGANATRVMVDLVRRGDLAHVQAVMLQGIAVAGFNVVDVHGLATALSVPVLVVTRRMPDLASVERALFASSQDPLVGATRVRAAARKWALIQRAGTVEPLAPSRRAAQRATNAGRDVPPIFVQRVGMTMAEARALVLATTLHGNIPEPLRLAHLIAGGIVDGRSRGRA